MSLGGGGGGAPAPTNQTVTQTNLPEYARPYFENLLQRGQAESYRQYTPYQGERLTEFTPAQTALQREALAMTRPEQFESGTYLTGAGGLESMRMGQQAEQTGMGGLAYGAQGAGMGQQAAGYGGMGAGIGAQAANIGADYFGAATSPEALQALSSPYMQGVVDIQQRKALDAARQAQLGANLGAARTGTYGGARQAVLQGMRESGLRQEMGDIQAKGLQSAYEQAMKNLQFGADLGLRGYDTGIRGAQTGIAGSQAGMEGARVGLQGIDTSLRGLQTGMQGAQQATQAGTALANIGTAEQESDLRRLQAQSAVAGEQRQREQQLLDMQYADFLRQRDYPMEQLGYYSSLLRGLPVQLGSTQTTYAQPPSMASQAGGLGLSALAMSKLLG
jgi:hypothetical protein